MSVSAENQIDHQDQTVDRLLTGRRALPSSDWLP
jgi:hypothetical protein